MKLGQLGTGHFIIIIIIIDIFKVA